MPYTRQNVRHQADAATGLSGSNCRMLGSEVALNCCQQKVLRELAIIGDISGNFASTHVIWQGSHDRDQPNRAIAGEHASLEPRYLLGSGEDRLFPSGTDVISAPLIQWIRQRYDGPFLPPFHPSSTIIPDDFSAL